MVGRKKKLNYEIIEQLAMLIRLGVDNRAACSAVGISESSFYAWMAAGKADREADKQSIEADLAKTIAGANADFQISMLKTISKAADDGDWRAAAWYLERRYPESYGKHRMVQHTAVIEATTVEQKRIEHDAEVSILERIAKLKISLAETAEAFESESAEIARV